ncbi:MAG: hypothetical protein R3356_00915 [Eudoraea sp.]|nr:hypothetical protein [Eudoraea sp.]
MKPKIVIKNVWFPMTIFFYSLFCMAQNRVMTLDSIPYKIYPDVIENRPDLPSPFTTEDGEEYVIAVTNEKKYAIIRVTLSNALEICPQLIVNSADFPHLAKTGLHSEKELDKTRTITGRPLQTITQLGRPNGLSQGGFMAKDENIISVLKGDNRIVTKLGLTHPQLAEPLFHVLNMMDADLALDRWNMAEHQWENIRYFYYNHHEVYVAAEDTNGGQKSIFNDDIEGSFYIKLWRAFEPHEMDYLKTHYGFLPKEDFDALVAKLSVIHTGEMEPQYIMRYGFYEGHTFWRTDPIAISFIFGLKSLPETNLLFDGELHKVLFEHFSDSRNLIESE